LRAGTADCDRCGRIRLSPGASRQTKIWRVGFLGALSPAKYSSYTDALRSGLRELGYVEGRDLVIEYRWADEKYERLPC
jgi:putative ABC transport system substrate-binding protein